MGFFNLDNGSMLSSSTKRHKTSSSHKRPHRSSKPSSDKSRSRSRSRSRHRKTPSTGTSGLGNFLAGGSGGAYKKHNASRGSGLGSIGEDSNYKKHSASKGSFFGLGNGSSRSFFGLGRSPSSYYKRSPRANFVQKAYRKLKRLLRDLVYWAKRHPMKVFLLIVVPLVTGGALTALLARFGLRLPPAVERMLGVAARTAGGGGSLGIVGEAVRLFTGHGGSGSPGGHGKDDSHHHQSSSSSNANPYGYSHSSSSNAGYATDGYGYGSGGYDDNAGYSGGGYERFDNRGYDRSNEGLDYGYGYGGYDSGYGSRGSGTGASAISIERGRTGDYQWERKKEHDYGLSYGDDHHDHHGGGKSSGGGFMGSVSRFFS